MSADNWAVCPRCEKKRQAKIRETEAEVTAAYGKVSVDKFDAMRESLAELRTAEPVQTFREDYEVTGAEDGVVVVSYSGHCRVCRLACTFRHEEPLDVDGGGSR